MTGHETAVAVRFGPLRKRLLSLGVGEIVAAAVFAAVPSNLAFVAADGAEAALWFAVAPLLSVLVQGGVYWLLARKHLPATIPPHFARKGYPFKSRNRDPGTEVG